MKTLPDGPERAALFARGREARDGVRAVHVHVHRIVTDLVHPLVGYRRPVFWQAWWHYVDIDGPPPKRLRRLPPRGAPLADRRSRIRGGCLGFGARAAPAVVACVAAAADLGRPAAGV